MSLFHFEYLMTAHDRDNLQIPRHLIDILRINCPFSDFNINHSFSVSIDVCIYCSSFLWSHVKLGLKYFCYINYPSEIHNVNTGKTSFSNVYCLRKIVELTKYLALQFSFHRFFNILFEH